MIISQLPELFVQRERALLGPRFDAMFSYPGQGAVRGASVNALRCTPQQFAALADFPLEASPFCASAFVVPQPDWKPGRHTYHHAGAFYAQEPSASAPAALLDVHPGMRVADLCAAPGGKTSQLAAALAGHGVLLANEFVAARAEVLRQNLERMGVTQYDQPLLDRCAALGAEILENAAAMLVPGGILVYSTCTFAPGEDEGQIAAFLARHPEFTLCDLSGCGFGQPGEANRTGDYPLQAEYCRRIWPCDGGEGHFMAKLQKAADAPAVELPRGKNGKGKGGKTPRVDAKTLQAWQSFAKELFPTLAGQPIAVVGDGFLLEPPALLPAAKLHVLRAGVPAGRAAKGRFEPAHALFMAYGAQCTNCEELTLADPRTAAWLRGEEIEAQTAQNGWCAVLVDGFPLGGGKASGGRIKNHYPKALRNLK